MQRTSKPDGLDLPSPQLQRNHSLSSDLTPSISGSSLSSPPSISPDPAYIAASAASQIVGSDRAERGPEWFGGLRQGIVVDTAVVSPGSLVLVNTFLDQLLFSFLASSRSTSIASLRPAILDVLKPRLGKEAIDGADEELQGYLAGGDAEELLAFHSGQEFKGEYNLNLIWRRTRLRCMVYTRLGDMEEEDEEMYLEREHEGDPNDGRPRLSRDLGSVSPAAAIFLTSILEFLGEHALLVAGEAAHHRMQSRQLPIDDSRTVVVEECDMEKLAFNTTLGRLWRSWRKRARSSSLLSPRPMSRGIQRHKSGSLSAGDSASRSTSISEEKESGYFDPTRGPSVAQILHQNEEPSQENREKGDELPEEPDFSDFGADASSSGSRTSNRPRPRSMIEYQRAASLSAAVALARNTTQASDRSGSAGDQARPTQQRQRSSSMPDKHKLYISPVDEASTAPTGGPDSVVRNGDQVTAEKEMPKSADDARTVPELSKSNPIVSTMYDGAISQGTEPLPDTMAERNNRGISTYTESSNYTDEYDHELAPQALNLKKAADDVSAEPRASLDSTLTSHDTFDLGEVVSVGHPGGSAQDLVGKENISEENGCLPGGPVHQPSAGTESDRQYAGNFANLATLQGHQLRTYDESGQAVKRDIPVLYEVSSNEDVIYDPAASIRTSTALGDEGEVITPTPAEDWVGSPPLGLPPLTPLRESKNAAHETSHKASSSAPSYDATSKPDGFVPTHGYNGSDGSRNASSSSSFHQGQPMTAVSRLVDIRSPPLAVNTGTERAAVQRVSPSPATPLSANGRTSTSSNRPVTSGSTHSQMSSKIKGMMGRESGDLIRQPIPKRTSSDGSGSCIITPNKEQDFEQLINSDETVRYTLTPQNMREMEVWLGFNVEFLSANCLKAPESPRWQAHSRSETAELADFLHNSAPAVVEPDRPSNSRSSTKLKGLSLRSNPSNSTSPTAPTHGLSSSPDNVRAQTKPIPKSPNPRTSGVLPRDPITNDYSLRDFADFIRSTGPDTPAKALPKAILSNTKHPRPTSSSSPAAGAGIGKPFPNKITKPNPVVDPPKKAEAQLPKRTTSKLQAREPIGTNKNATSDLADFFRSGPVGTQVDGSSASQRPPAVSQRTVSTNGSASGRIREALNSGSSIGTTQDSLTASHFTQSSTNSRTGLLDSSNRAPTVNAASVSRNIKKQPARNDDPPEPARAQRGVRDPYAIDSDDEIEGGNGASQAPPAHEEESLSDFLRNYTPSPPSTATRTSPPVLNGAPKPAKQSGPTMRERLARNTAVLSDHHPLPPKAPEKPPTSKSPPQSIEIRRSTQRTNSETSFKPPTQNNIIRGRSTENVPQLRPINPRVTSPHLISQTGTKKDSYRPTQPTSAKHVDRGPRKQLQAREEHGVLGGGPRSGGLSDLAEFLRDTEPPAPSGPVGRGKVTSPVKEKEESTFGRMFGRRRRA